MNALTVMEREGAVSLALPEDASFEEWVRTGHSLIANRRQADWMLADWWRIGQQQHRDEPQFKLIAEHDGADPKRLTAMARVAEAFPPHLRAANVSFEVHREIAALDPTDRLEMIVRASNERWNERVAHSRVVEHKYEQGTLLPDDDPEYRSAVEIIRAWNRSPKEARRYFMDLATSATLGVIVEDANA